MQPDEKLTSHFRLKDTQKKALKRLGIETARDLLYHFPTRYISISKSSYVKNLKKGDQAILFGKVDKLKATKAYRKKIPMAEGVFEDSTGSIDIVWFHQPYIANMLSDGSLVKIEGKVAERKGKLYLTNPEYELIPDIPSNIDSSLFKKTDMTHGLMFPVYTERRGITSKWIFHTIKKILASGVLDQIEDPIPEYIRTQYNLPSLSTAFVWIHAPQKDEHSLAARKRFAFEEIFIIQLEKQRNRVLCKQEEAFSIIPSEDDVEEFVSRFTFSLTKAQKGAIDVILDDLSRSTPMSRLLEGDVGSGKTAVAAATMYATIRATPKEQDYGTLQAAYMAPTEILAKQQFAEFIDLYKHLPIQLGLITSSGCAKFPSKVNSEEPTNISRAQLLKWVKNGEIALLVGTHSLIQKTVEFEHLAYVVIDEQHRFGIRQRRALTKKDGPLPNLLSMTATPIPRTLALTMYGDLDLTLLDEMPAGRKPVISQVVIPKDRKEVYEKVKKEIDVGRQAYVICPRIEEPDPDKENQLYAKSVKAEAKRLKKEIFKDYEIDILHGKQKAKEKESVMKKFANHETDILVATSVVEVGVNVPNATVMIIEGAQRFGLAQLHQLRGRVIRSTHQAYCFAFTDTDNKKSVERLQAFQKAENGFALAEEDLKIRGAGMLLGSKQSGISDIGMEALRNLKMVDAARTEARTIAEDDFEFKKYPALKERVDELSERLHTE